METRRLGDAFDVSALTLGGGGIGGVWGPTDEAEAIATFHAAIDAGITFIDVAPMYQAAEERVGAALATTSAGAVRVGTKCLLGHSPPNEVKHRLETSLRQSMARLGRDHIDVFLLHGMIIDDGWKQGPHADRLPTVATPWSTYINAVVPSMEELVDAGQIGTWGITTSPAAGRALTHEHKPGVVQAVTNLLNSSGNMNLTGDDEDPRQLVSLASQNQVGVIGIRAVAAGALTDAVDRSVSETSAEAVEFAKAANFRALAAQRDESAASLAHRYALTLPGVDTVVLGVKNRQELHDCLTAEALPRLTQIEIRSIEQTVDPAGHSHISRGHHGQQ